MAIQDDNTILKKGDLKAYHEAIAPMLGGTFMVSTNNSDYYSTDEKVVGVWIDGKPLYQKTFDYGGTGVDISNTTWTDLGISISGNNIERIIMSYGTSRGASNDNCMFWFHTHCESSVTNVHGLAARYNGGVRVKYITLQYTKTTDTAGSAVTTPGAYDINFPNTWPENTEIYFGNGLYGQRFTGTITAAASSRAITRLDNSLNRIRIVQQGGWLADDVGQELPVGGFYGAGTNAYYWAATLALTYGSEGIFINSYFNNARNNAPYDVWATYTK